MNRKPLDVLTQESLKGLGPEVETCNCYLISACLVEGDLALALSFFQAVNCKSDIRNSPLKRSEIEVFVTDGFKIVPIGGAEVAQCIGISGLLQHQDGKPALDPCIAPERG